MPTLSDFNVGISFFEKAWFLLVYLESRDEVMISLQAVG
jgi:hypothetical protein